MSLDLILVAIVLAAASGVPGLCLKRSSSWGERIAVAIMGIGSISGLAGVWLSLQFDQHAECVFPWPAAGNGMIGLDALSAFFLVPIFLMGTLGAIYGLGYWPQREHLRNGRQVRLFWGLAVAGMALLVISKHAMAFLLGWEVMAISALFLVSTEDFRAECRRAALLYIIATHLGTLSLFALFALWRWATGSYVFRPIAVDAIGLGTMNAIFFLALIAFGVKAGVMPLHFWLPPAHTTSPSHVSAMLSGVVLKMGIYGLIRFLSLMPAPPAIWGGIIIALGAISGLCGTLFAIGQHDLKRLLAYHSVENIGIILMGLGLATLGRSMDRPEWIVLGLAGCLLHVWNHALFKSLLFFGAGSVVHAAGTREIDRLGGLAKTMPWTAAMFLVGAVAICGLPPLNGFVSELFVYLGLLQCVGIDGKSGSAAILAVPVLAMIGALAVACFVKVFGVVFLGEPRTSEAAHSHESPLSMRGPMVILAGCCLLIGLAPALLGGILDKAIASSVPEMPLGRVSVASLVPLQTIGLMAICLIAVAAVFAMIFLRSIRAADSAVTWDCGYARPTARMQYSAASFAQMIVSLFRWILRPRVHQPPLGQLFPPPTRLHTEVDDVVLDRLLLPAGRTAERCVGWIRTLQRGLTQHYILYILITVVVLLSTLFPFGEVVARLFAR